MVHATCCDIETSLIHIISQTHERTDERRPVLGRAARTKRQAKLSTKLRLWWEFILSMELRSWDVSKCQRSLQVSVKPEIEFYSHFWLTLFNSAQVMVWWSESIRFYSRAKAIDQGRPILTNDMEVVERAWRRLGTHKKWQIDCRVYLLSTWQHFRTVYVECEESELSKCLDCISRWTFM